MAALPILFNQVQRRATGITHLLRDLFTTAEAAPMASPRTCEPGPGALVIRDTGNNLSIVGAALVVATGAGAWGDPSVRKSTTIARADGRALLCQYTKSDTNYGPVVGYSKTTGLDHDGGDFTEGMLTFWNGGSFTVRLANGSTIPVGSYSTGVAYTVAVILHTSGFISCVSGGAFATFPQMTVLHISAEVGTTNFYPAVSDYNSAGTGDNLRIFDLGGSFANDAYYATLSVNDVITLPNG